MGGKMRKFIKYFLGIATLTFSFSFVNTAYSLDLVFSEDRPDLRTLDPRITQSRHEEMLIVNIFDQLIAADANGNHYPGLAKNGMYQVMGLNILFI